VIEGLERCPSSEYAREVALIGESASKGHSVFPYAPPFNIEPTLTAFAQGIRQNDIFEQMRAIARRLTTGEMKSVAKYYGMPDRQLAAKQ
jgi:hypothetical protein